MITLTKEWLLTTIAELEEERDAVPGTVNEDAANALAAMKLALASLEAVAVGFIDAEYSELLKSGHIESCSVYAEPGEGCITLFTAPPAPVSVPDLKPVGFLFVSDDGAVAYSPADWPMKGFNLIGQIYGDLNACRAAMLQSFGNSEQLEPVTTAYKLLEGYVLVPVHPTMEMLDEFDSIIDYGAEDSKEAWSRLIAAAPLQEVK
ncbi:hypothetical protein [Enterobacter hormaechei]|uniref:hypothetical protein n=1 Tax=Enterobacter hormaechei TaxID=158836 RepID=UPI001C8BF560|nr:hypothetical protein [Enterobacter hormaechei]